MSFVQFVAHRFHSKQSKFLKYSRPIIQIATAGISVGIVVMLSSIAISNGFKHEISENVAAASAHYKILPFGFREDPEMLFPYPEELSGNITQTEGVNHVSGIVYLPALLESEQEIFGVLLKGRMGSTDKKFSDRFMIAGHMPDTAAGKREICISSSIARKLELELGDALNVYLTQESDNIKQRRFKVSGIFKTGVPSVDEEVVFCNHSALQDLLSAVPRIFIRLDEADKLKFNSNAEAPIALYKNGQWIEKNAQSIETSALESGVKYSLVQSTESFKDSLVFTWSTQGEIELVFDAQPEQIAIQALEIHLDDLKLIPQLEEALFDLMPYDYELVSLQEDYPEIFNWLALLDTNVVVLLIIMAIVSLVNMASALLVLIIEKTNSIALLKTMGSSTASIRKIFLYIAGLILVRGLLIGNILCGLFFVLQKRFHFLTLDESQYYVSFVPIKISLSEIFVVNLVTMAFCLIVLILPTILIAKIYPAKALRIE
ncbi:MAG: ABC transporter permease [Luteibaculum sp.]